MSIQIEIASQNVQTRNLTRKSDGKPLTFYEQEAFLHKPNQKYPDKMKITLGDNAQPYPVGKYTLSADSFYVDRFGGLSVRPVLSAVAMAKAS